MIPDNMAKRFLGPVRSTATGVVMVGLPRQRDPEPHAPSQLVPCLALPGRVPAAVHIGACRCFSGGAPPHTP